ncbi:MAG: hypothetical protein SPI90_01290 [Fusobacterium mortiferum]|nr:hypothetical protein [Fusobacterium mortiferum]
MKKILKKYCGKKLDGRYLIYSYDKLIERGKYEEGKRERLWVKYYKNGKIKNIGKLFYNFLDKRDKI